MAKIYATWRTFQEDYLRYVAALLLLGPALLSMLEIVRRYGFNKSFPWQQDLVTYGILSGVFLFFSISQSRNLHLRVTIVLDLLRSTGGRKGSKLVDVIEVLVAAVGVAFCVFLVWRGLPVAERMLARNRMAESQIIPLWPFFFVFLIGIALMAISFAFQVYEHVQILRGKDPGLRHTEHGESGESIL
jgi:C4-dicarboxylate transporter DctQ subunit